MQLSTRKVLDRSFTLVGFFSIAIMAFALVVILVPIFVRGAGACVFRATVEHRRSQLELFNNGSTLQVEKEQAEKWAAAKPVYDAITTFREKDLGELRGRKKRELRDECAAFEDALRLLIGPRPDEDCPPVERFQFGQNRWDRAQIALHDALYIERYEYPTDADGNVLEGRKVYDPRKALFAGTSLEPAFDYLETNLEKILQPRLTFYWRFFTDESVDAHIFGGIRAEILGTFYLALGTMLFAIPIGVLSAIYLVEYARQGVLISLLRTCISTLAGVPSIVFGLFGLAFFVNTIFGMSFFQNVLHISKERSVIAGSLTLATLILPTVIRASEEALRAVPSSYREAAMGMGASKWRTILTVILPAGLPGILTGIVISMGRAAGETAPIIFTAAVSMGAALKPWELLSKGTPALSWNIYNLCTEHEAVEAIRHVQYGMVMTLVLLVLCLNFAAILLRARISKKLKG